GRQRIFRPDVMLSVGPMVTGVERRAVLEATMQAGAKTAYLIDKPMAAAIGAKVAVSSTDGIVVVNLGAGSTEMAVIVVGEIVAGLQRLLAQVPEARRSAVNRNGLVLSGGGAQLPGMGPFLTARVGIPARVASDPQSCVAVGTGMALDNMQVVRRGQHYIT